MAPPASNRAHVSRAGLFVLGCVVTALITGAVTYKITREANTVLVVQQQRLQELQQYEASGSGLDNSVRAFSDAIVSGKGIEKARDDLRSAVGTHASTTFAMRDVVGADYSAYMAKINAIRSLADHADSPREGMQVWQAAADAIALRKKISDRIKQQTEHM